MSDIQGVEDLYTDPQMISVDKRFGEPGPGLPEPSLGLPALQVPCFLFGSIDIRPKRIHGAGPGVMSRGAGCDATGRGRV